MKRKKNKLLIITLIFLLFIVNCSADEMFDLGVSKYLAGDFENAILMWASAFDKNPKNQIVKDALVNCLIIAGKKSFFQRDFGKANKFLTKAHKINPDNEDVTFLLLISDLERKYLTKYDILTKKELDTSTEKSNIFALIFWEGKSTKSEDKKTFTGNYVEHVVLSGETLQTIAFKYFNNTDYWMKIWKDNPSLKNPHRVFPGMKLRIYIK